MSVLSWLWRYHSNMMTESSLSSSGEVINEPGRSWPRLFSVRKYCCAMSCKRRSFFPVPSLRLENSRIMRTWVWWLRRSLSYLNCKHSRASVYCFPDWESPSMTRLAVPSFNECRNYTSFYASERLGLLCEDTSNVFQKVFQCKMIPLNVAMSNLISLTQWGSDFIEAVGGCSWTKSSFFTSTEHEKKDLSTLSCCRPSGSVSSISREYRLLRTSLNSPLKPLQRRNQVRLIGYPTAFSSCLYVLVVKLENLFFATNIPKA